MCTLRGENISIVGWKSFEDSHLSPDVAQEAANEPGRKEGRKREKDKTASPDLYPAQRRRCQEEQLRKFIFEKERRSIARPRLIDFEFALHLGPISYLHPTEARTNVEEP